MYDNESKGISYLAGFFMLIAFAVAGLVLASTIGAQVWLQFTGKSFTEMERGMTDPANSDVMKIIQSLTAVIGFLVPTIVTAALLNRKPFKLIGFSSSGIKISQVGLAVFADRCFFIGGHFVVLFYQPISPFARLENKI